MSNWGTLTKECVTELGQAAGSSTALDNVKQALCESILFNQRIGPYAWQQALIQLPVEVDNTVVPLPLDFMSVVGDIYYVLGDSPLVRRRLVLKGLDEILQSTTRLSDEYSNTFSATPRLVAVDPVRRCLLITPSPNSASDYIELRYMRRGDPPVSAFDGTNWSYTDPYTGVAVTDNFTNIWFKEGRYLTKNRALYLLWSRWYGGTDAASARSQVYQQQWIEEQLRLNSENTKYIKPARRRGWI